jgi:putative hydrolase of the HAD superfamily
MVDTHSPDIYTAKHEQSSYPDASKVLLYFFWLQIYLAYFEETNLMTNIRILFLDLDETLYPSSNGLWEAIGARINEFMMDKLDITIDKVSELRKEYFSKYGTTLNGLRINFQIDPYDYLTYVHDVPINDFIQPDPGLREMLVNLPQKRIVFTNASIDHAKRVLERLGIINQIDQIIDIIALNFENKPKNNAYIQALTLAGERDPKACVLVDDRVRNLLPGGSMGMTTVLVGENQSDSDIDFCISSISELTLVMSDLKQGSSHQGHSANKDK